MGFCGTDLLDVPNANGPLAVVLPFVNRTKLDRFSVDRIETRVIEELREEGYRIEAAHNYRDTTKPGEVCTPASLGVPEKTLIVQGVLLELRTTPKGRVLRGMIRLASEDGETRWEWESPASSQGPEFVESLSLKSRLETYGFSQK